MLDGTHFRYLDVEEDGTTIAIGGLLGATAAHVLPAVVLAGYLVRVLRAGFDGDDEVPTFDDWAGLFRDGLGAAAVALPYQIPPALALLATVGTDLRSALRGPALGLARAGYGIAGTGYGLGGAYYGAPDLTFVAGAVAIVALELVFGYLSVVAVANYARTGSVLDGFDLERVRAEATLPRNVALCATCALLVFGFGVLRGVVSPVPFVGPLLASVVAFYGQVVVARMFGCGYGIARPPDDRDGAFAAAPE